MLVSPLMMTQPNRLLAILAPLLLACLANGQTRGQAKARPFSVVEATIPEMQAALESKRTTSRELVTQYLTRIATYDRVLHSLVTVNPKALAEAGERDRERAAGSARPAARHPRRVEGQHPHNRYADHRRRAGLRGLDPAV